MASKIGSNCNNSSLTEEEGEEYPLFFAADFARSGKKEENA